MSTWLLGDRLVNRVGFGAMRLPQTGAAFEPDSPPRDRGQAIAVLRKAIELGVNHIDTAAFYFSSLRSANELINSALSPYPDDLVIATKVGPSRDPSGAWRPPAGPGDLRGQVEENLRQLGRDHLDLVYQEHLTPVADRAIGTRLRVGAPRRAAGLVLVFASPVIVLVALAHGEGPVVAGVLTGLAAVVVGGRLLGLHGMTIAGARTLAMAPGRRSRRGKGKRAGLADMSAGSGPVFGETAFETPGGYGDGSY